MTKEKLIELNNLQARIKSIELLREYLLCFLEVRPFNLKVEIEMFGHKITQPFYDFNGKTDAVKKEPYFKEDGKFIIDSIDQKLTELDNEFKKL